MIYKYKGVDAKHRQCKGKIEASSLQEAKNKLHAAGIVYSSIKEEKSFSFDWFKHQPRQKMSASELAALSRELAIYLRSGITIVSAIKITSTQYEKNKKIALFLQAVKQALDEGKSFYQALEEQKIVKLPEFFIQSIRISEQSGILHDVLSELARYIKEQSKIGKQIQTAFAYPLFMLIVSVAIVVFMLAYIVPKITAIFANMHQELPKVTQIVIDTGNFMRENAVSMAVALVFVVLFFSLMMRFNTAFRKMIDTMILKMPFFGPFVEKTELARFAYMNALLLHSGIPLVQAVNLSASILNNTALKDAIKDAAQKVVEGSSLSSALKDADVKIDPAFIQTIVLGEETSQMREVMQNISELYFEENHDTVTLLLSLLEPVLMLVVGGVIGFIVTAMLLPIFSMSIG